MYPKSCPNCGKKTPRFPRHFAQLLQCDKCGHRFKTESQTDSNKIRIPRPVSISMVVSGVVILFGIIILFAAILDLIEAPFWSLPAFLIPEKYRVFVGVIVTAIGSVSLSVFGLTTLIAKFLRRRSEGNDSHWK